MDPLTGANHYREYGKVRERRSKPTAMIEGPRLKLENARTFDTNFCFVKRCNYRQLVIAPFDRTLCDVQS